MIRAVLVANVVVATVILVWCRLFDYTGPLVTLVAMALITPWMVWQTAVIYRSIDDVPVTAADIVGRDR